MPVVTKEPWFVPRRVGWGLTPATWQGWAVTALFIVCVAVGVPLSRSNAALGVPLIVIGAVVFVGALVLTGTRPGRRGND